jgi:hypothetical protein
MDYGQLLEDLMEFDKHLVVIIGQSDIITSPEPGIRLFKNLKADNFWRIIGRGEDSHIIEALSEYEIVNLDCDGEWEFKAVLKWSPSEYDDYGRLTMRGYLDIKHIEFRFIQTFQQRERQIKLDQILTNEFDDLFKLN